MLEVAFTHTSLPKETAVLTVLIEEVVTTAAAVDVLEGIAYARVHERELELDADLCIPAALACQVEAGGVRPRVVVLVDQGDALGVMRAPSGVRVDDEVGLRRGAASLASKVGHDGKLSKLCTV